ncbi:MAG: hypothetical protein HWE34_03120 [Methylocystaceae bacterium]|nr:hypothetical protein [Methylocystaceae bacterium]
MYGNIQKNEAMRQADEKFIQFILSKGFTRETAAIDVIKRGWKFFQNKNYKTAMERFNQGWLLDPENADSYRGFAVLAAETNKPRTEVEKYFQMALTKNHGSTQAYADFGWYLITQNELDKAIVILQKGLKADSKAYNVRSTLAFISYLKKNYPQACKWAKDAKENGDKLEKGFLEDMCQR